MKKKITLFLLYIYLASLIFEAILMLVTSWLPSRGNIVLTYFLAMLAIIMVIVQEKEG